MKEIDERNQSNVPIVLVDKSLNQYSDQVLFKEKVDKANEALLKMGLPEVVENLPGREAA